MVFTINFENIEFWIAEFFNSNVNRKLDNEERVHEHCVTSQTFTLEGKKPIQLIAITKM